MTACYCIGPQNGAPACPCMMKLRGNDQLALPPQGCICPPGSEMTCMGDSCPRRSRHGLSPTSNVSNTTGAA
jgi:hypothetical protein